MEFESNIGQIAVRRHEALLEHRKQIQAEQMALAQKEHEAKLQKEPYILASTVFRRLIAQNPYEAKKATDQGRGYFKVYAPLKDAKDSVVQSQLGLTAKRGLWTGAPKSEIIMSLEISESTAGGWHTTEQVIAILFADSERPYGLAISNDAEGQHFGDPNFVEAMELAGLVREAAELQGIPVLPLELPPEDQAAV